MGPGRAAGRGMARGPARADLSGAGWPRWRRENCPAAGGGEDRGDLGRAGRDPRRLAACGAAGNESAGHLPAGAFGYQRMLPPAVSRSSWRAGVISQQARDAPAERRRHPDALNPGDLLRLPISMPSFDVRIVGAQCWPAGGLGMRPGRLGLRHWSCQPCGPWRLADTPPLAGTRWRQACNRPGTPGAYLVDGLVPRGPALHLRPGPATCDAGSRPGPPCRAVR